MSQVREPDLDPVMLYDGECGLCHSTVQLVLRHDHRGTLRFAALQSDFARDVIRRHPEIAGIDSMIWVEPARPGAPERVYVRSSGSLKLAAYLGGLWKLLLVGWLIPRPLRDGLYRLLAANRYRIFGRRDGCLLPSPQVRARFLDHSPAP